MLFLLYNLCNFHSIIYAVFTYQHKTTAVCTQSANGPPFVNDPLEYSCIMFPSCPAYDPESAVTVQLFKSQLGVHGLH